MYVYQKELQIVYRESRFLFFTIIVISILAKRNGICL